MGKWLSSDNDMKKPRECDTPGIKLVWAYRKQILLIIFGEASLWSHFHCVVTELWYIKTNVDFF